MLRWINNSLNKNPTLEIPQEIGLDTEDLPGKILEFEYQCESEFASSKLIAELTSLYTVLIMR
jgi:hypothetical protein